MKVAKILALDKNLNIITFDSEERLEVVLMFEVDSENPTTEQLVKKYDEIISAGIKQENIKILRNYYKD
jgi:hypothetical protein